MAPPAPKPEELVPHPVKDQLPGLDYCITSTPHLAEAICLGFQHFLLMLGTTVLIPRYLVPQMGGDKSDEIRMIQTLQFVAGVNTLAQTLFGTRLPAVIGGSYTFIPATLSIIKAGRYTDIYDPHERFIHIMRGIQGAMISASLFQIVIGFGGMWGNVTRLMSPLSTVPLVALTGFGLYELGFPLLTDCVEVGLPQLILLVIFSQYLPHVMKRGNGFYYRFAVLFSVIIVWCYALILTSVGVYDHKPDKTKQSCRTDQAGYISAAPWFRFPSPVQWGKPTFHAGEAFAMMATSFVALVESTGGFIAVSRFASATPMPYSVLSRGVGWQGMGLLLSGLFGTGNGSSVSIENAGLLGLTRVGSRSVIQIAAGFMILFSLFGKFGAVMASIPAPIVAALYCFLFAYVGAGGLAFLQFCNLNSYRTKFILAFSIYMGLSIPQYFNERVAKYGLGVGAVQTNARWFNDMINVPFSSKPFVAGVLALILDVTMFPKDSTTRKDRGMVWWDKFKSFKTDTRTEDIYYLPWKLNKFFPQD